MGFYGKPGVRDGQPGAVQRAGDIEAPILALMAGDDPGIDAEQIAELERALAEAGVEHDVITYDGAPHSFFDRKQEEFADGLRGRLAAHAGLPRAPRVDGSSTHGAHAQGLGGR